MRHRLIVIATALTLALPTVAVADGTATYTVSAGESRWNQSARSAHGAVGVGQLMPRTAAWVARDLMGEPGLDITASTDNIRISAHLLAWLLDEGGSADRALAMYLQDVYGVRANGVSAAAVGYAAKVTVARRQFR